MTTRFALFFLAGTALTTPAWAQVAPSRPDTAPLGSFQTQPSDIGRIRVGSQDEQSGQTGQDIGGGLMIEEDAPKARSTVTRDFINKQSPSANPYQLMRLLPGANVSSPDNNGLNGGNITVRGFNSDQMGLTIEGAPVNDSGSYSLFPQEYVDSENIQQIVISQGSPDLDSPHIGASGGVVNIYERDPSDHYGGFADFSFGTHSTFREFARLDTGLIGRAKAFLSFSHYSDNHWRGPGGDDRYHVDGKIVGTFGNGNRLGLTVLYNDAVDNFYRNPTLAQFNQFGNGVNFDSVFLGPPTPNAAGVINQSAGSNYFKTAINPFRNLIASAPSTFNLAEDLTLDVTPYFWYGYGNGGGTTTLNESGFFFGNQRITQDFNGNGQTKDTVLLYNPSNTETYRPGIINKLTYNWENHKLVGGYWYEYADHTQTAPFSLLNPDGTPQDVFGTTNQIVIASGPLAGQTFQRRDQTTITKTNTLFVGDSIAFLNDRLNVDIGVKQAWVTRDGTNRIPGTIQNMSISDSEALPSAGVRYKLNDTNQIFGSVFTTFRTPANFVLFDAFSVTSGAKTLSQPGLKSETSTQWEVGHRFQGSLIDTSVAAFYYNFQNRQVSSNVPDPAGGTGSVSTNINVGATTGYGIDAEIGTRPINNFRPYIGVELMKTRLEDNYQTTNTAGGVDFLPTKGKQMVRAPQTQFSAAVDYDDGKFFANVTAKWVGPQYSTFMNDESIPAYGTVDVGFGYRFDDYGYAKSPTVRLNLFNITDKHYLSGVNSVQPNAQTATGVNGGTIRSSTPNYFLAQGFSALVTVSSGF